MTDEVEYTKELDLLIRQKLQINAEKNALDERESQVKARIEYLMQSNNISEYCDEAENIVTIKEQTRKSIDTAAVKTLLGADVDNYMRSSTFVTMRVTTKEDRERTKKFVK